MRNLLALALLVSGGCGLMGPEEKTLPPAYVRVCLSLEPWDSDPGDCRGDGHWQSERAHVRNPLINIPLADVPVRLCHSSTAETCRNAPNGHFLLDSTDREGYAVFRPSRPEGKVPEDNVIYNVILDVDSVQYKGCALVVAPPSQYGSVVEIGPRYRYTEPEDHKAHIAELWMILDNPWCDPL